MALLESLRYEVNEFGTSGNVCIYMTDNSMHFESYNVGSLLGTFLEELAPFSLFV